MSNPISVAANLRRFSCQVLATSGLDKTEIVRILTEESATQLIEIDDATVVIDYIAVQR